MGVSGAFLGFLSQFRIVLLCPDLPASVEAALENEYIMLHKKHFVGLGSGSHTHTSVCMVQGNGHSQQKLMFSATLEMCMFI